MPTQKVQNFEFEITVNTQFLKEESSDDKNEFVFSYRVKIKNKSNTTAQLVSRKWVIKNQFNEEEHISGPGVVGMQPHLAPGQVFEYESYCPLNTPSGSMSGSYQMTSADGNTFDVRINEFFLIAPQALH